MSVEPDACVEEDSTLAWLPWLPWLCDRGLKAVGSQARMLPKARLMTLHQPNLSSRVSADSRWRIVVWPDLRP